MRTGSHSTSGSRPAPGRLRSGPTALLTPENPQLESDDQTRWKLGPPMAPVLAATMGPDPRVSYWWQADKLRTRVTSWYNRGGAVGSCTASESVHSEIKCSYFGPFLIKSLVYILEYKISESNIINKLLRSDVPSLCNTYNHSNYISMPSMIMASKASISITIIKYGMYKYGK